MTFIDAATRDEQRRPGSALTILSRLAFCVDEATLWEALFATRRELEVIDHRPYVPRQP